MSDVEVILLPRRVVHRVREEAHRLGLGFDEYVVEMLSRSLDPRDRALEYIEAAASLLEQARRELEKGDVRQAAEKLWGAAALSVKAYAYWREGKRLASHGELWRYTSILRKELGKWVYTAWNAGQAMHVCFYEGWCTEEHVEDALDHIGRLVRAVSEKIKGEAGK